MGRPIATIYGADDFEVCYVSFKARVAKDGPLVGTPQITSSDPDRVSISEELLNGAPVEVNDVVHNPGELFSFKATSEDASLGKVPTVLEWETAERSRDTTLDVRKKITQERDEP